MKKLFIILFCMLGMMASAEDVKLALLQPRVADGSEQCTSMELNMVRGELRKAFSKESSIQVLTRADVDIMMQEQGFQRSGMVESAQRKQIGVMTGAQYICVSTITKYGTQLYIEAYLVNIETGEMTNAATQYVNVRDENYMFLPSACSELAKEMLSEISLKRKSKQKVEGYVDLGLPSGTLWKSTNEDCGLVTYEQAYNFYGENLPSIEQWKELRDNCIWTWKGNGYNVKGKSGETIFLPAEGVRSIRGVLCDVGSKGYYRSSTLHNSEHAWILYFDSGVVSRENCLYSMNGMSVRLVKKPE